MKWWSFNDCLSELQLSRFSKRAMNISSSGNFKIKNYLGLPFMFLKAGAINMHLQNVTAASRVRERQKKKGFWTVDKANARGNIYIIIFQLRFSE